MAVPLFLNPVLAGRLAHHPGRDITTYTADFAAAQDRLSELTAGDRPGDPAVAAAFEMSYQVCTVVQDEDHGVIDGEDVRE